MSYNNEIQVVVTGDFCPGKDTQELLNKGACNLIYNDIYDVLIENDLSITNLECPLIDIKSPIEKTGPNLSAPENTIELLKYGKFDIVALANNHIMDQGPAGIQNTIELCEKNGIEIIGAGNSIASARKIKYKQIRGINIAILNFTEKEYSIAGENKPGANPLNLIDNYNDITEARRNADYIIVIVHSGVEHYNLPTPSMIKIFRFYSDIGADAIICNHSHYPTGFEIYNGKPIFYGLGNFVFDRKNKHPKWSEGYLVELSINELTYKSSFKIYPYHQFKEHNGITLLKGSEKELFMNELSMLSSIIQNDKELIMNWDSYIAKQCKDIAASFLPFLPFKRWLLVKRRMPAVIRRKLLGTWNKLSCQSLLDVNRDGLNDYLNRSN